MSALRDAIKMRVNREFKHLLNFLWLQMQADQTWVIKSFFLNLEI